MKLFYQYENKKVRFYPIKLDFIFEEIVEYNEWKDIPDMVYGKFAMGAVGFNPAWSYQTVSKFLLTS
jgi:hypothetical protein